MPAFATALLSLAYFFPLFIVLILALPAYGLDMELGLAAAEEGDDRQRPSVLLKLGIGDYQARAYHYGRQFGPVTEKTTLLNISKTFPIPFYRTLEASFGLAMMNEETKISYSQQAFEPYNRHEKRFNAGFATGLYWVYAYHRSWYLRFGWESAIFPAGVLGGLFLVTARKQFIFLATGISFS